MTAIATQCGMDVTAIQAEVDAGYVAVQKHPNADLFIYNYTQRAQWEWRWTAATRACRGLILDADSNVVARPFEKFFTVDQLEKNSETVPVEPFEAFEKYDGSLGILYWLDGKPQIATRGSFTSEQAIKATEMLGQYEAQYDPFVTLLFEIIYPENRIVVDYGDESKLVLLAAIDTENGEELPYDQLHRFGFPVAKRYDGLTDFDAIRSMQNSDAEGFVVRFASGMRVKIKFDEYKRLHKLLTGITPRHIWESLREGVSLDAMYERTPDEFHDWLRDVLAKLNCDYALIENTALQQYRSGFVSRKDAAEYFKTCDYPAIMFAMMDGKSYAQTIWRMVRPEAAKAFHCDSEAA